MAIFACQLESKFFQFVSGPIFEVRMMFVVIFYSRHLHFSEHFVFYVVNFSVLSSLTLSYIAENFDQFLIDEQFLGVYQVYYLFMSDFISLIFQNKSWSLDSMSERLCQFFIRGRCLRDVCEFQHPADLPSTAEPSDKPAESEEVAAEVPPESGIKALR